LSLITTSHTGQILRQDESWVCSVGIQSHRSCRVRNTNGLGGKSTQKEIHTHIQTRGHYLYLYLYLFNQQNDLSLGLDSDRRPKVCVASVRSQGHESFSLIFISNIIGVLSKIHCMYVCVCVCV